jgi:ATP-binding cassette subfamily B (MDR/TAP) protein 8
MFSDEIEKARKLNVKLSFGIGIFQGLSNLFINGIVLGVIFAGKYKTQILYHTVKNMYNFIKKMVLFFAKEENLGLLTYLDIKL